MKKVVMSFGCFAPASSFFMLSVFPFFLLFAFFSRFAFIFIFATPNSGSAPSPWAGEDGDGDGGTLSEFIARHKMAARG